jgi:hypothetical protein
MVPTARDCQRPGNPHYALGPCARASKKRNLTAGPQRRWSTPLAACFPLRVVTRSFCAAVRLPHVWVAFHAGMLPYLDGETDVTILPRFVARMPAYALSSHLRPKGMGKAD